MHYLKEELYALVRTDPSVFEFLQSGSLDGIWYWDVDKPEEEWMSPKLKEVFGYEDFEIANTSAWWQEAIFPEDLEVALKNFELHLADPAHPYDQLVRYRHRDGSTVWVRCRGLAIRDEDGVPHRLLGTHTDDTDLMQARLELESANEALATSNQDWKEIAAAGSHDLRAPVRHISGALDMLLSDLAPGELSDTNTELLEIVQSAAQRLEALIEDLLTVARLSGETPDRATTIAVADVVSDVATSLCEQAPTRAPQIIVEGELPNIVGEPVEITQLVTNLLSNSVKYCPTDTVPQITVTGERTANGVAFEFTDNGIGIDSAQADRIFAMFQRLHAPDAYEGTGVGLALVKSIAQKHGGSARLDTNYGGPGVGARFVVEIPSSRVV